MPTVLRLYVLLVSTAGAGAMVRSAVELGAIDVRTAVLALLGVACAAFTVPVPGTGLRVNADTPFLLALVDGGAGAVAVIAAAVGQGIATIASGSWRRPHTLPFNAGAGAIGTGAAVVAHAGLHGWLDPVPVLAAGLAAFAVTSGIVVGAVRIASGRMPSAGWRDGLPVTGAAHLASASLGHLLAESGPILGTLLLVAPLVLLVGQVYTSHRDRVRERAEREAERDTLFLPTLEALIAAIEARDPAAFGHNHRVRAHAMGCAQALGIRDEATLQALRYGAVLHDVGRIAIPDRLLHAGALSDEDLAIVRRHAEIGSDLIRHVPFPAGVAEVVRHHHERWDGAGYPDGLAGRAIPLPARIVAVCDAFDDLCSGGWRPALSREDALGVLATDAGAAFDREVVEGFARWIRLQEEVDERDPTPLSDAGAEIRLLSREQARLTGLAYHDELTGLRNGRALQRDLAVVCGSGRPAVVLVVDLDGFKQINDQHGHEAGDRALRMAGEAIALLPSPRVAYRNGGDEFVVVVPAAVDWTVEAELLRRAIEDCALPVRGGKVPLRASVGGAGTDGRGPAEVLRAADDAMYGVKLARKEGAAESDRASA